MSFFYNLASLLYFVSNLSPNHVNMEYNTITLYLLPIYIYTMYTVYSIDNIVHSKELGNNVAKVF